MWRRRRPASDNDPFKLGLTLYSASADFRAGWYDFDGLLDRVAELGIGPGIEIVASQMVPTYPVVVDDFVRTWRAAFDRHGFVASSFGANLDMGRRRDRDMTPDEEFEFSTFMFAGGEEAGFPAGAHPEREAGAAASAAAARRRSRAQTRLRDPRPDGPQRRADPARARDVRGAGFAAARASWPTSPRRCTRCRRPCCAPCSARGSTMRRWRNCRRSGRRMPRCASGSRSSSATCAAATSIPVGWVRSRIWRSTCTATSTRGSGPTSCRRSCTFTRSSTTSTSSGQEPAIDYPELVRVFVEGGYRGYWSSEWEGHAFAELGEVDPLLLVRRQHDLIRRRCGR